MYQVINKKESVIEWLKDLNNLQLVTNHNQYCHLNNSTDDIIYHNDDNFFDSFFENKVLEILRAVTYGNYEYNHKFVMFNGYGNLQSFNNPDTYIDFDSIAEKILEEPSEFDVELIEQNKKE